MSNGYESSDHQTETMMRDVSLILGAAFVIVTLIYVVFQRIENRERPVSASTGMIRKFIHDKTKPDSDFTFIGTLANPNVGKGVTFIREIMSGGYNREPIYFARDSKVYFMKDGEKRHYLIFTQSDTSLAVRRSGIIVAYISNQEPNRAHFVSFQLQADDPERLIADYFLKACRRSGGVWSDYDDIATTNEADFKIFKEKIVFSILKNKFERLLQNE